MKSKKIISLAVIFAMLLSLVTLKSYADRAVAASDTEEPKNVDEQISVEELLKSIIIGNANDAAVVLAELVSGSEEKFVK